MWTIEEFILPGGRWQWRSQRIVRSMCPSQYPAPGDSSDPRLSCWFSLSKVAFSLMLFNDDCQAIYPRPTAVQLMHWLTSACRFCILYICLFVHLVNSLVCAFLCFFCVFVYCSVFSVYIRAFDWFFSSLKWKLDGNADDNTVHVSQVNYFAPISLKKTITDGLGG